MATLQRLLASHVLAALSAREHLRVSAGSEDALCDELEAAIAPLLPSITPYLMAAPPCCTSERGFGDRNAEEAVAVMIDVVGDSLSRSNHVDDIFADDARIRRDATRAVRELLLRYMAGELEIEDDATSDDRWVVQLDGLGYVVAAAAGRAPEAILRRALGKAARTGRAELASYDHDARVAVFRPGDDHPALLAIEETIAGEIARLVESGRIELPSIEQLLEIPAELAARPGLGDALVSAAASVQKRARCVASCARVSPTEIRVSLTPLAADVAQRAEAHFDELLVALESALTALEDRPSAPDSAERAVQKRAPTSSRRQAKVKRRPLPKKHARKV